MNPTIIFEKNDIVVIDKPAGLIVHLAASTDPAVEESVASWFVESFPQVKSFPWPDATRAGIVHRLDQDTSGVMVLAKTPQTLEALQKQFQAHTISKKYFALVYGTPHPKEGSIDVAIGRHPGRKTPMSVIPVAEVARGTVREASTDYKVIETFNDASLVEATIHTGRTHQIRLHMKYIGHPILGDDTYGTKPSNKLSKKLGIARQMLHAKELGFNDPKTGEWQHFEAPLPPDFSQAVEKLKHPD